jgi:PhnB protein
MTGTSKIREGYTTVTPWIIVDGVAEYIPFLEQAFDAQEIEGSRMLSPDGTISHVELHIGTAIIMMFDSQPGWPPITSFMRLYVDDAEATYQKALAAGATSVTEVRSLFFGDRVGRVADPAGNIWWIQEHIEDLSPEEMGERAQDQTNIDAMQYVQSSFNAEMKRRGGSS